MRGSLRAPPYLTEQDWEHRRAGISGAFTELDSPSIAPNRGVV
jgi:hypothetical protein